MKATFENVGRRRLVAKGSRAVKELELEVPDLKVGEGRILPSGEIALNDPKAGLIVLRADHVHTYIVKQSAPNPLDGIVDVDKDDDDDDTNDDPQQPETKAPPQKEAPSNGKDEPLIDSGSQKKKKGSPPDSLGGVTDGSGIGSY